MRKALLFICSFGGLITAAYGQSEETSDNSKKIQHHVGVQINELVRQVFNFSNNSSSNTNPYLLVYSINSVKTGWGARMGIGYTYRSFTDDDGINHKETDINDINLRVGVEKAFQLSNKWSAGVGLDGLWNMDNDRTKSITRSFDTTTTITKNKMSSFGGGAMGWLRYNVTDKVVIGTETSFYYTTGQQDQEISITFREQGPGSPWSTKVTPIDNKVSQGVFSMPVAIYLLVRF